MALWVQCGSFTVKTGGMSYKVRLVIAFIVIIIISWFDFQFLSQHPDTFPISETIRRLGHFLFLFAVMFSGIFALSKSPIAWIKVMWLYAYIFAITILFAVGLAAHFLHIPYNILFAFYKFRIFFCSPLPLFILYIFSRLAK